MTGWGDAFSFVSNQMLNVLHVCTVCKETPPLDINTVVWQDGAESCYQIAVRPGEGFWPDPDEMRVLDGIDSRLKELLPPEEFEEVTARHPQTVSL